jgi:hypothetical protein
MSAAQIEGGFERLERLQEMAIARGCRLEELYDYERECTFDEDPLDYWLYVPNAYGDLYAEPVEFNDMDEVEADLNSRPLFEDLPMPEAT